MLNYKMTHRRNFLKAAAAILGGNIFTSKLNGQAPIIMDRRNGLDKIGVQLFSIPRLSEKDFAGTMRMLAEIGYKEIEFFGPYSFSAQEDKERWQAVAPSVGFSGSGFFGLTVKEVKKILDDNGLSAPSMHTGTATLRDAMDQMAEAAHVLNTKYVVLPSAPTQKDLDGYKKLADQFNEIGGEAQKRGIRFAYHNHGNGLKAIDGTIPFELMMERTDPKLVFFQMDIYWMTAGGVDVSVYLDKYRGRFRLMHVKDMAKDVRFSGDGGDPQQWMELFPFLENAGGGVLDLEKILSHAKRSGVEHFIVERDLAPNPEDDLRRSFTFLKGVELRE
jgi:sugar phosphate isomerase/epimerase